MPKCEPYHEINTKDLGFNKGAMIFRSRSKHPEKLGKEKHWVFKPSTRDYTPIRMATEVIVGQILVKLIGKTRAAKSKFDFDHYGTVSRILSEDGQNTDDLQHYLTSLIEDLKQQKEPPTLPLAVIKSLVVALCIKIILGDRDIKSENMIMVFDANNSPQFIYSIDHEHTNTDMLPFRKVFNNHELIAMIKTDPRQFGCLLIASSNNPWSWLTGNYHVSLNDKMWFTNKLGITNVPSKTILSIMHQAINKLTAGEFALINEVASATVSDIKEHIPSCNIRSNELLSAVEVVVTRLKNQIQDFRIALIPSTPVPSIPASSIPAPSIPAPTLSIVLRMPTMQPETSKRARPEIMS